MARKLAVLAVLCVLVPVVLEGMVDGVDVVQMVGVWHRSGEPRLTSGIWGKSAVSATS